MTATASSSCRRIFVVGVPRSGTTLVQSLLAAHDALTSFTESHFFDRHFHRLVGLGPILTRDPAPRLRAFLAENGEPDDVLVAGWKPGPRALLPLRTAGVAGDLLAVLDALARRRGKAGWIEKTPRHLRYVPWLQRLCHERVDFVHVVRDGLDTVASLHNASARWERHYGVPECVQRWNQDMAFSITRLASPRDHFVVYEALVEDPETELRRLCGVLDLDWQAQVLTGYARSARSVVAAGESWKDNVGRPMARSRTAHHNLTSAQRRAARDGLRQELYQRVVQHTVVG